jgi:hypothetical protein
MLQSSRYVSFSNIYCTYLFNTYTCCNTHPHTVPSRYVFYVFAVRIYYLLCTVRIHRNPNCTILCAIPEFSTYRQQLYHSRITSCTFLFLFFSLYVFGIFHNFLLCRPSQRSALSQVPSQVATLQKIGSLLWAGEVPDSNPGLQDYSSSYFPSLASSFLAPTPAHYMSPSPLCVLLTQYCDDVHSAGGRGKMLLGRGLGHDWRGLGHDWRGLGHDWRGLGHEGGE